MDNETQAQSQVSAEDQQVFKIGDNQVMIVAKKGPDVIMDFRLSLPNEYFSKENFEEVLKVTFDKLKELVYPQEGK